MATRLHILIALLFSAVCPASTFAQAFEAGAEIRFRSLNELGTPNESWQEAALERVVADTVWVRHDGKVFPLSLASAEVRVQTEGHMGGKGFGWGLLAGALAGGVLGALQHEPRYGHRSLEAGLGCAFGGPCPPESKLNSRIVDAMGSAARGALVGGAIGWLIGRTLPDWVTLTGAEPGSYSVNAHVRF